MMSFENAWVIFPVAATCKSRPAGHSTAQCSVLSDSSWPVTASRVHGASSSRPACDSSTGCMVVVSSMTHRQLTPASRLPRSDSKIASNTHSLLTTTSTTLDSCFQLFLILQEEPSSVHDDSDSCQSEQSPDQ